jgi:hypothetical protein
MTVPAFRLAAHVVAVLSADAGQPARLNTARASAVVRPVNLGTVHTPVAAGDAVTDKAAALAASAARTPSARMA